MAQPRADLGVLEDRTGARAYTRRLGGDATYWTMGSYLLTWLARGRDTDGRFYLAEVVIPKVGGESSLHTHIREDEAYHILEGEFTFRIGGRTTEAEPGDYEWQPRGIEHGFELKGPQAKALVPIFPVGLEGFLHAVERTGPETYPAAFSRGTARLREASSPRRGVRRAILATSGIESRRKGAEKEERRCES